MRAAYQRNKWRRRMVTLHCKANDLADAIRESEGESAAWDAAMNVAIAAAEGVTELGGYDHERRAEREAAGAEQ